MKDGTKSLLDSPDANNIGRSEATVSPALLVRAPTVTLVNLKADDPTGRFVTVYLKAAIENFQDGEKGEPYGVAFVDWGSGGHQHSAIIDFANGTAFSLACSYLRVKAALDPLLTFGGVSLKPIRLAASTAYGVRPAVFRGPARTIPTGSVGAGNISADFEIPTFARKGSLIVTPQTAPVPLHVVELANSSGAAIATLVGFEQTRDIPVPSEAVFFRVTNAAAVAVSFRIVWELAL
jgi:hypothetical protein